MKLVTLFFICLGFTVSAKSFACSCAPAQASEWMESSYSIFIGQATERSMPGRSSQKVTFRVLEQFKGSSSKIVTLKVFGPDTSCAMMFEKNVKYVVSTYLENGNIATGQCSAYEGTESESLIRDLRSKKTSNKFKNENVSVAGMDVARTRRPF